MSIFTRCWVHRGDHRILALRHKILLLMIKGLARKGGAEVSPSPRDALVRKRISAVTSTDLFNLSIFYFHFLLPCMLGQSRHW
jgi:hypothetical protein